MKNHGTVMKNQGFAKVGKRSLRGRFWYHFASLLGAFWTNFPAFGPSSCLLAWTGLTGVADRVDMGSCEALEVPARRAQLQSFLIDIHIYIIEYIASI